MVKTFAQTYGPGGGNGGDVVRVGEMLSAPRHYHLCACCGSEYSEGAWRELEFLGINEMGEWRNCPCGSTLLKPLHAE